ncbi:zinc finger protein 677 [Mastacembelus armatus]|uniref:zinc finger protein 677 n=1 Tax=Mastacembelus armatus TaxID=205130 RepID=UPI000E458B50|nr:zinc finger protein 677-like [Mastacembelus armatus]
MENCSFQSQVMSVMELLARAAVAEINRRVDASCAVLRLEVSRSRRDIDLLKRKCEAMEAELRRTRVRARRRVLDPPKGQRFSSLVQIVLDKGRPSTVWDTETQNQPQQCEDMKPDNEAEHILIKEECAEDDTWKNNPEDKPVSGAEMSSCFKASQSAQTDTFVDHYRSAEDPAKREALLYPADGYSGFPERDRNQNEREITVKREKEEEADENSAPFDSDHRYVTEEGDGQLWHCRDASGLNFSCAGQQFEQIPTVFTPQSGLDLQDMVPRNHSAGKTAVVSTAQMKKQARTFGCMRPQPDEGHSSISQINSMDQSSILQQPQYTATAPHASNADEDFMEPNPPASAVCGPSHSNLCLVRRMRTPWRSGIGEKRFSCTYCEKNFMRFCQLKEHLRSHTGEKPFSCLQCGRSFTKQCNLIRHAVVHSGEKPHECSLCGKCFTRRCTLKSHQKTAH